MIKGLAFSRSLAAAAAFGWASAAGAEWFRREGSGQRMRDEQAMEARASDLSKAIAAKAEFDDRRLSAELRSVGDPEPRLLSREAWNGFLREIGDRWSLKLDDIHDRGDFSLQQVTLRLRSPGVSDWPIIVASVRAAEQRPGIRVLAVRIRSSGDQQRRTMDEAEAVLSIGWTGSSKESTAP
jgi:hypothetical protein